MTRQRLFRVKAWPHKGRTLGVASRGTVMSGRVWAMLDECAPSYSRRETRHNMRIMWSGKTYHRFPLGKHGKSRGGSRYEVQFGHVRNLVRMFEIMDCARKHFEQL